MDSDIQSLALGAIINVVPPQVQKLIVERILYDCDIKLTPETIEHYENYWIKVNKNFHHNFMES